MARKHPRQKKTKARKKKESVLANTLYANKKNISFMKEFAIHNIIFLFALLQISICREILGVIKENTLSPLNSLYQFSPPYRPLSVLYHSSLSSIPWEIINTILLGFIPCFLLSNKNMFNIYLSAMKNAIQKGTQPVSENFLSALLKAQCLLMTTYILFLEIVVATKNLTFSEHSFFQNILPTQSIIQKIEKGTSLFTLIYQQTNSILCIAVISFFTITKLSIIEEIEKRNDRLHFLQQTHMNIPNYLKHAPSKKQSGNLTK